MKFTKDQIQKASLTGIVSIGLLYYYCFQMMGPLSIREGSAINEIAILEPKIRDAKLKINRVKAIEGGDLNADLARRVYGVMQAKIPNGQPVAWLPTRLTEMFKKYGIVKPTFRSLPDPAEAGFLDFKTSIWMIDFPGMEFTRLGLALAGLENQEGLMQINNLQISNTKEPGSDHAQLTISTLVKSEN